MNISAPFIHRPVMTTIIMVALVVFGLVAYFELPVSELPDVDFPTIVVTANMPGERRYHGKFRGDAIGARVFVDFRRGLHGLHQRHGAEHHYTAV